VKDDYAELAPRGDSIADVVVLAQAWKKSHEYIRRHNWYADVLELDASTIDLESRLISWGKDVSHQDFRPEGLLLVPAPKNAKWVFRPVPEINSPDDLLTIDLDSLNPEPGFGDWYPEPSPAESPVPDGAPPPVAQKLRPLAHLSIRDQSLATAVLMCLAEAVVDCARRYDHRGHLGCPQIGGRQLR
jgi:hypothetical protein